MADVRVVYTGKRMEEIYAINKEALKKVPRVAGVYMRDQFKENISSRRGMIENGTIRAFRGREFHLARVQGKNPLNDSGKLLNSIHIISVLGNRVVVGIDDPDIQEYANVMQDGATIVVTKGMKKHFWKKYYETMGGIAVGKKSEKVLKTKKNERLSNDAAIYRAMALKKIGSTIKIEARTYMKITPDIQKGITEELKKLFYYE